jgi:subtilase family serine protease
MRSRSALKWQFVALTAFLVTTASAFVTGVGAGPAQSTNSKPGRRVGEVAAAAQPEAFQGYLPDTESMTMIISLEPRNQVEMEKLKADLYDPSSAQYRQWLTPTEFGQRFGRTEEEFNHAVNWLKGQGFVINNAFANRLDISFTGTVDTVQQAFNVQMGRYWDAVNNRSFHSNMQPPTLPREIDAMTEGLEGLSDAVLLHAHAQKAPMAYPQLASGGKSVKKKVRPDGVLGSSNFMAPADLAVVYDFKPLNDANMLGQGQTVGTIFDSDVKNSDVALYRNFFGLPPANLARVVPKGLFSPGIVSSGEFESILDISSISAAAPLAEIDLILIPSLSFGNIRVAEQDIVNEGTIRVVNESFGGCEQDAFAPAEQTTFNQAVIEGIAFFASAGDEGAECFGDAPPGVKQIQCPACYGGVTAVGGTQIQATFDPVSGSITSLQSEDVWNSPPGDLLNCAGSEAQFPAGGTGGGVSQSVAIPSYQSAAQGFVGGVPAGANRFIPDVSALAGVPFTLTFLKGRPFFCIGTSEGSPLWAAMIVLVNQLNASPIGSPNPLLYRLGVAQYKNNLTGSFRDITVGNNTVLPRQPCDPKGVTGYSAGVGFDLVTGWGSPDLAGIVKNAATTAPPTISSLTAELQGNTLTLSGTATDPKKNIAEADITLMDSTGAVVDDTGVFAVAFAGESSVPLSFSVNNMGSFPTAVTAGLVLIDSDGNASAPAVADFGQADPGGPSIKNVTLKSAAGPLTIKGSGFSTPIQLEVNGVIAGAAVPIEINGAGTKLKIAASVSSLDLNSGPDRIRILVNGLRSNIFVLTLNEVGSGT